MSDKRGTQKYINNFRRRIARFLKPGIGLTCNVYPAKSVGTILEFTMGPDIENDDIYNSVSLTMGNALSKVVQHAFGGNLDAFVFKGTNVILEKEKIILIKDNSLWTWTDDAAQQDVVQILKKPHREKATS